MRFSRFFPALLVLVLVPSMVQAASVDYFLKIEGVDGETTEKSTSSTANAATAPSMYQIKNDDAAAEDQSAPDRAVTDYKTTATPSSQADNKDSINLDQATDDAADKPTDAVQDDAVEKPVETDVILKGSKIKENMEPETPLLNPQVEKPSPKLNPQPEPPSVGLNPQPEPPMPVDAQVEELVSAQKQIDPQLRDAAIAGDAIHVTYDLPSKLFGFFPVSVPAEIDVDAQGEVKVQFPWWSFLTKKPLVQQELAHVVQQSASQETDQIDSMREMGTDLQDAMQRVDKRFTLLSNILKKMSETSQSIMQNMK